MQFHMKAAHFMYNIRQIVRSIYQGGFQLKYVTGFLLVFALLFSTNSMAQGLLGLAEKARAQQEERNDGVQRTVNCIGLPYHRGVGCTMYVGSRTRLNFTRAYMVHLGVVTSLNITTMNNGFVHAITIAPIEYGDGAAIEWQGGRYSIWLGGGLSLASWSGYAARLMVQADQMMLEAGFPNIDPALSTVPFVPPPTVPVGGYPPPTVPTGAYPAPTVPVGGYPAPTVPTGGYPAPAASGMPMPSFGFATPSCSIVRQEIQMAMEAVRSSQNTKAGMEDRNSIWTSGMAGIVSQNQQRLQELQEQLTHCSN
jgi:hypothetical protein